MRTMHNADKAGLSARLGFVQGRTERGGGGWVYAVSAVKLAGPQALIILCGKHACILVDCWEGMSRGKL